MNHTYTYKESYTRTSDHSVHHSSSWASQTSLTRRHSSQTRSTSESASHQYSTQSSASPRSRHSSSVLSVLTRLLAGYLGLVAKVAVGALACVADVVSGVTRPLSRMELHTKVALAIVLVSLIGGTIHAFALLAIPRSYSVVIILINIL